MRSTRPPGASAHHQQFEKRTRLGHGKLEKSNGWQLLLVLIFPTTEQGWIGSMAKKLNSESQNSDSSLAQSPTVPDLPNCAMCGVKVSPNALACPNCGEPNPAGTVTPKTKMAPYLICSDCGERNHRSVGYCGNCGRELDPTVDTPASVETKEPLLQQSGFDTTSRTGPGCVTIGFGVAFGIVLLYVIMIAIGVIGTSLDPGPTFPQSGPYCGVTSQNRLNLPNWESYRCLSEDEAANWDRCLRYSEYADHVRNGCRGSQTRCCPPQ